MSMDLSSPVDVLGSGQRSSARSEDEVTACAATLFEDPTVSVCDAQCRAKMLVEQCAVQPHRVLLAFNVGRASGRSRAKRHGTDGQRRK